MERLSAAAATPSPGHAHTNLPEEALAVFCESPGHGHALRQRPSAGNDHHEGQQPMRGRHVAQGTCRNGPTALHPYGKNRPRMHNVVFIHASSHQLPSYSNLVSVGLLLVYGFRSNLLPQIEILL